jgi:hypothetical protein
VWWRGAGRFWDVDEVFESKVAIRRREPPLPIDELVQLGVDIFAFESGEKACRASLLLVEGYLGVVNQMAGIAKGLQDGESIGVPG